MRARIVGRHVASVPKHQIQRDAPPFNAPGA